MSEVLLKEENLVDLGSITSIDNILFELTTLVEKQKLQGEKIKINLGKIDFSQSQFTNMISVLKGFSIDIEIIYSESTETKIAAMESGLTVSGQTIESGNTNKEEAEQEESGETLLEDLLGNEDSLNSNEKKDTLYIKQNLRSGQRIEHDGNLIIIGDCNAGSEVIATGDIVIWGVLSGIAHAGRDGDKKACIRAFKINAIQIRIADYLARRPDKIEIEKSEKTSFLNPEEAKICEEEIVIYALHQEYN